MPAAAIDDDLLAEVLELTPAQLLRIPADVRDAIREFLAA